MNALKYILLSSAVLVGCCRTDGITFRFDNTKEVSGKKIALKNINPELPSNWDGYNYVVLEYKISTAQRFQLGFTTDWGYNELRVMSYVPNAWNRLAIPLKYYTQLPDAAFDLAATNNKPRYMGWINLGGKRGPMHGVDSVGVRMRKPIGNPEISIRNIYLAVEDPGDAYLEDYPAYDEFGQSIRCDYPEKVKSLDELKAEWQAEDNLDDSANAYGYSKYGGYLASRYDNGTGYFRVVKTDGRWWFVDPEGYLFLSVGVDCVGIGQGGSIRDVDNRREIFKELPPEQFSARGRKPQLSFGAWNLTRRYGKDFEEPANQMVIRRMHRWGLNTIANWSDAGVYTRNEMAFIVPLGDLGMDAALMSLCDVYAPEYKKHINDSIKDFVSRFNGNPWLIGYFVSNEPAWINQEERLCQIILDGSERPIQKTLQRYLDKNGDSPATRRKFILETFDTFLCTVSESLKKYDPNHLNLGIRFGDPDTLEEDLLAICKRHFDVFSFNCYQLVPDAKMLDRAAEILDLPMIVGEYHFGTVDRGLAQSLWQVDSESERGVAYQYYTENAYSHPNFIGSGYFQWCDQDITGRLDGENYNCGMVDVTDRPYKQFVNSVSKTSENLYEIHSGVRAPSSVKPKNARGHGAIPDLWNE